MARRSKGRRASARSGPHTLEVSIAVPRGVAVPSTVPYRRPSRVSRESRRVAIPLSRRFRRAELVRRRVRVTGVPKKALRTVPQRVVYDSRRHVLSHQPLRNARRNMQTEFGRRRRDIKRRHRSAHQLSSVRSDRGGLLSANARGSAFALADAAMVSRSLGWS